MGEIVGANARNTGEGEDENEDEGEDGNER